MTAADPTRPADPAGQQPAPGGGHLGAPGGQPDMAGVRLDIGRVTLRGYRPGERGHYERAIQARLAGQGVPAAAARRAATAILDAVNAELGQLDG